MSEPGHAPPGDGKGVSSDPDGKGVSSTTEGKGVSAPPADDVDTAPIYRSDGGDFRDFSE